MPRRSRRPLKRRRTSRANTRGAPLNKSQPARLRPATVRQAGNSIRISHTEFVANVYSTANFTATRYFVTPTSTTLFPWLAPIAGQYQYYHIERLELLYMPGCPTTTPGNVCAAVEYNPHDELPATYASMASMQGFRETPVFEKQTFPLDRKQLLTRDRLATGAVPAGADRLLYQAGSFIVATASASATPNTYLGRLMVRYDIQLMTPQPSSGVTPDSATVYEYTPTAPSTTNVLGTSSPTPVAGTGATISNGTIHFANPGDYLLSIATQGTGMDASQGFTHTVTGSGTVAPYLDWLTQTGTKAVQTLLVQGVTALTRLALGKAGAASFTHNDVAIVPYDTLTARKYFQAKAERAAELRALANQVGSLLLDEGDTKYQTV